MPTEKRTETLPVIRIEESLLNSLLRSAAADDRSLTEYVRRVLWKHEFGHARTVGDDGEAVATEIKVGQRLSPRTEFKPGQPARNHLPVGSARSIAAAQAALKERRA